MNKYTVEIFWSDEDEGFIAIVPELAGCNAWGITQEQALFEIHDAIAAWLEARNAAGEYIPAPIMKPHFSWAM